MLSEIKKEIRKFENPVKKKVYENFFKTKEGQYGHGDIFLGLTSSQVKSVAVKFYHADISTLRDLLKSEIHEDRMVALRILVHQFRKGNEKERTKIVEFYLDNTSRINNWDLVDASAYKILGEHLINKDRSVLYKLAISRDLWEKRIAIVSTYAFIAKNEFADTFKISTMLMNDKHDLIHKATGWMLREVGKRNQTELEKFLKKHCRKMPRTALRYSIEKFDAKKRKFYMTK